MTGGSPGETHPGSVRVRGTDSAAGDARSSVIALVVVDRDLSQWWASLRSLTRTCTSVVVLSPVSGAALLDGNLMDVHVRDRTLAQELQVACRDHRAVLVVTAPVIVPEGGLDRALGYAEQDGRVCSVSFLSNNAGYLSFPDRNTLSGLTPAGHDENTATRTFRRSGRLVEPTVIPVPGGSCVLLPSATVQTLGGLRESFDLPEVALLDLALRGVGRGFVNVLDSTTFVTTPFLPEQRQDAREDPGARAQLHRAHPWFPALYDVEKLAVDTPLADALSVRRAELGGLAVLIDGNCLGPYETGTQVAVLAIIAGLTRHPMVGTVVVPIPSAAPPPYAQAMLADPKVVLCRNEHGAFPDAPTVDIIHRPFQPDGELPLDRWSQLSRRIVVTIQDLIAYNNGRYHIDSAEWLSYRSALAGSVRAVDAVVAISQDTDRAIRSAGLLPFGEKVSIVPNGTDHLSGPAGRLTMPQGILLQDNPALRFVLVLGTSYAHKNRDLAIRGWQELRRRGHQIELVLAGVVVPFGSTRNEEVLAVGDGPAPIVLPDVSEAERNWLLRHAEVVLYPTSAEGFGLVPFEAAEFDTPTVFVSFGPLAEFLGAVPVTAADWTPQALADAIAAITGDPGLAAAQVAAVQKQAVGRTWEVTVDELVSVYLDALARPSGRR